ncbi:hypothetical protein E2C01_072061 [Portunus trituberculatus]|uniref:Uncharacterized protein n=1 Tax=Portunus trituberculatus TaxID=210409 RepID=A0A5B7I5K0_PORTR|nr:hypothetical protein [Portunus trituberculatus]
MLALFSRFATYLRCDVTEEALKTWSPGVEDVRVELTGLDNLTVYSRSRLLWRSVKAPTAARFISLLQLHALTATLQPSLTPLLPTELY